MLQDQLVGPYGTHQSGGSATDSTPGGDNSDNNDFATS